MQHGVLRDRALIVPDLKGLSRLKMDVERFGDHGGKECEETAIIRNIRSKVRLFREETAT